jgi:hypothetical protein
MFLGAVDHVLHSFEPERPVLNVLIGCKIPRKMAQSFFFGSQYPVWQGLAKKSPYLSDKNHDWHVKCL